MSDLLAHAALSRVVATPLRSRTLVLLFLIGTALPDVVSKGMEVVIESRSFFSFASHTLIGVVIISYVASLFVAERLRVAAFLAFLASGVLHVAVDMLESSMLGGPRILFPFLHRGFAMGWIGPHDSLWAMPAAALVLALFWRRDRVR